MRIRWRGFELPTRVVCDEATRKDNYAKFSAEPFERGFGTTIGNSLRRVLLSSLEGAAIVSVKFDGVLHEFSTIEGVYEDVADIVLNLKQIRVRMLRDKPSVLKIDVKRKGDITGADVISDADVEVVNKDLHICTLTKAVHFGCEMTVCKGRGYRTAEDNDDGREEVGRIPVDSVFSPVVRVNYKVGDARVGQKIDYDRLTIEMWTDGTVTPEMALVEAAKILRKHLTPFTNYGEIGPELAEPEKTEALPSADGLLSQGGGLLDKPVSQLGLSVRASHCLDKEGIRTIGELVTYSEDDLLEMRNFGKTSLDEVKRILADLGLTLATESRKASKDTVDTAAAEE
jgi:DNA-directed RNA polymerase subunit alpha